MYTIHVDGKLLYKAGSEDEAQIALNVKPSLDIESAGSLSFVLPPGNAQYDAVQSMKSIVTMRQDGKMIFRGRVTESERDSFNQKNVYCEGDRSFLLDSLWEERDFTGKVQDLFRQLITNHNSQVETVKRFTVGSITAVDAGKTYEAESQGQAGTRRFSDTSTKVEELLSRYGGYIRTRTEGNVTTIDWLKDFDEENSQPIRFGVNLLDLKDKLDAKDVFTCLIPLGYSEIGEDGTYTDPVNIKSVNGGLEYIQDDEMVALYGKIWRSKTWGMTKDPAELKAKGWEYLKTGAEIRTLTLKAVDMHFVDGSIDMLTIGKKVQIESDPHAISLNMVLAKMEPDPENPENTQYTFGVKPRTLSEAVIRTERETDNLTGGKSGSRGGGGGGRSIQEEAQDILRWAKLVVDEANGLISANAGEIDEVAGRTSSVELILNGKEGQAGLIAKVEEQDGRLSSAEVVLNGTKDNPSAGLVAKVDENGSALQVYKDSVSIQSIVDGEIIEVINASKEQVSINAAKVNLSGYVTTSTMNTAIATLENGMAEEMFIGDLSCGSFIIDGVGISFGRKTFLTSKTSIEVNASGGVVYGVTLNRDTDTIYYLDWE